MKIHAITEMNSIFVIMECSHLKKFIINPILIQGSDIPIPIKSEERWEILKELFKEKNIKYNEIHSKKGNILQND